VLDLSSQADSLLAATLCVRDCDYYRSGFWVVTMRSPEYARYIRSDKQHRLILQRQNTHKNKSRLEAILKLECHALSKFTFIDSRALNMNHI